MNYPQVNIRLSERMLKALDTFIKDQINEPLPGLRLARADVVRHILAAHLYREGYLKFGRKESKGKKKSKSKSRSRRKS